MTETVNFQVYAFDNAVGRELLRQISDAPFTVEHSYNGRDYVLVECKPFTFVESSLFAA